jgi:hypothetical protein
MKTCTTCRAPKPLTEFHRHRRTRDGYAPICKTCRGRYLDAHRVESAARDARYNAAHRERITAKNHYRWAHSPKAAAFSSYKNMVFCAEWDTEKDTPNACVAFSRNAENWMLAHCKCPGVGWELHVEKTPDYPCGYFGPTGIRWVNRSDLHENIELARALRIIERAGYTVHPPK